MKKFVCGLLIAVVLFLGLYAVAKVTDMKYGWTDQILSKITSSEDNSSEPPTAEDYMSEVKVQMSEESEAGTRDLRFVCAVKGTYDEETSKATVPGNGYGWKVATSVEREFAATKYYNSVEAGGVIYVNPYSEVEGTKTIDDFAGREGYTFFIVVTINGISSYDTEISVTPYVDIDGEKMYGVTRTTSVNQLITTI